jgi:hypothetical protein
MFQRSNKIVNILVIVVGVLSTLLVGILFFNNMRQNELNEELNRAVQEKLTLLANKPSPKLECPKVECPKMECPKMECPKQPELKCPEVPSCPPCPTMDLASMKQDCPKCPKCPKCPDYPSIKLPESIQEPKECPPPKECPAPKICPQPQACPPPRRCPSVRIVQKPCPQDKILRPLINEVITKQTDVDQSVSSGDYYPFNELKGLCPRKTHGLSSLAYLHPMNKGKDMKEQKLSIGQQLISRGIQMEESPDVTEGPLLTADFTGNNQNIPEESVPEEPASEGDIAALP